MSSFFIESYAENIEINSFLTNEEVNERFITFEGIPIYQTTSGYDLLINEKQRPPPSLINVIIREKEKNSLTQCRYVEDYIRDESLDDEAVGLFDICVDYDRSSFSHIWDMFLGLSERSVQFEITLKPSQLISKGCDEIAIIGEEGGPTISSFLLKYMLQPNQRG